MLDKSNMSTQVFFNTSCASTDGTTATFTVEPFARYCLLNGVDELAFLQAAEVDIAGFEAHRAYPDL